MGILSSMSTQTATALFASRLRERRMALGLSQAELGTRIGLTFDVASTRINRYEKGHHTPDLDTAERLAAELGVPLAYLVTRDEALAQAILGFTGLSRQGQARVLKAIRAEAAAKAKPKAVKVAKAPKKP